MYCVIRIKARKQNCCQIILHKDSWILQVQMSGPNNQSKAKQNITKQKYFYFITQKLKIHKIHLIYYYVSNLDANTWQTVRESNYLRNWSKAKRDKSNQSVEVCTHPNVWADSEIKSRIKNNDLKCPQKILGCSK